MKKSGPVSSGTGAGALTPVAVRYTCGTMETSPSSPIADDDQPPAVSASQKVDGDTSSDSDMAKVKHPSARWSRAEEIRHALHDLTPVKDLVFRLGKSRGISQSASAPLCSAPVTTSASISTSSEPNSLTATSVPLSPAAPPDVTGSATASPEPDRWTRISEFGGRISRTVGGKLSDFRSERMLSRQGSKLSTPTTSDTISEEDILQELELAAADQEDQETPAILLAPSVGGGVDVPPDISFRSVATPVLPTSDGAPATGGVRRDFSLDLRNRFYARLQRRRRTAPTPDSDTLSPCDHQPASSTLSLSSLQTKYGQEASVAVSEDEQAEEALTLLEKQQPSGLTAAEAVGSRWRSWSAQLVSRLLSRFSWKLTVLLLAILLALPCADFGRGLLVGSSLSILLCWWLFRLFGLTGGRSSSCCLHGRSPVCRHLDPPGTQEFVETPIYKGWMHELNDTHYECGSSHLDTSPVYVRIEGDLLRITRYKGKLSRRAIWTETLPMTPFGEQRIYDVSGADVRWVPSTLHHSKVWARRYPLCISLAQPAGKYPTSGIVSSAPSSPTDEHSSNEDQTSRSSPVQLHLFARTDRDKEEWYRRFKAAATVTPPITPPTSPSEDQASAEPPSATTATATPLNLDCYMLHLLPSADQETAECHVAWFNALVGRLVFDLIQDDSACSFVQRLVQKKLSRIKLPYFIGELRALSCDLGSAAPRLTNVDRVYCDERGLWLHLGVHYDGGASVTLCSRLNLIKLTSQEQTESSSASNSQQQQQLSDSEENSTTPCHYDQQDDDTPESSSDEESSPAPPGSSSSNDPAAGNEVTDGTSTQVGKRLLKVVDRVASSRYFKQATQISYVKKKMEDVSNTPIELSVHLLQLNGTMCINVPPSPSDRLWYGFDTEPCVQISVQPRLGTRDVTMSQLTDWITSSLVLELKKLLVLPNMDDLEIPFLRRHNVSSVVSSCKPSHSSTKDSL